MYRKRTIALLTLLLLIVIACTLARTPLFFSENGKETSGTTTQTTNESPLEPAPVSDPQLAIPEIPMTPAPMETIVTEPTVADKGCFVGGCSGQICSDSNDLVSTCEWRESYACYQSATCERQSDGQCGWTETPSLNACIKNANSDAETVF